MRDIKALKLILGICALLIGVSALAPGQTMTMAWTFLEVHGQETAVCALIFAFFGFLKNL